MKYLILTSEIKEFENVEVGEWADCLFEDEDTGERFFVELRKANETLPEFIDRCMAVAKDNFDEVTFIEFYAARDAEILGYDTY
jgi:hypothetical protein